MKHFSTPLRWVLVLLLVLAPMGRHAVGAVLCIETDGTVKVEDAVGYACGATVQVHAADVHASASVEATDAEAASHCDACIDIVLPGGADGDCVSLLVARGPSAQVDLPVVAVVPPMMRFTDAEAVPVRHEVAAARTAYASFLTPLRSVVLLN